VQVRRGGASGRQQRVLHSVRDVLPARRGGRRERGGSRRRRASCGGHRLARHRLARDVPRVALQHPWRSSPRKVSRSGRASPTKRTGSSTARACTDEVTTRPRAQGCAQTLAPRRPELLASATRCSRLSPAPHPDRVQSCSEPSARAWLLRHASQPPRRAAHPSLRESLYCAEGAMRLKRVQGARSGRCEQAQ